MLADDQCLVAQGSGGLKGFSGNSWGDVSVRAITRTVLEVTVALAPGYTFQVVSRAI